MTVLCYRLTGLLRAETPLHIGSGFRTGTIKRTRAFVPGSALRGAVGTALMKAVCKLERPLVNHEECSYFGECSYAALFGEESGRSSNVFFRYSYPTHLKCMGSYLPAPMNLHECKNPQCRRHYKSFYPPARCDCGSDLKRYIGFQCGNCGEVTQHPIDFSRVTGSALDRGFSAAATVTVDGERVGTLHTVEAIGKGSMFSFEVLVSGCFGGYIDMLKSIFQNGLADEGLGACKSRGLGKVSVEGLKVDAITEDYMIKRAENINTRSFVVRLLSPMLLEGKFLDASSLLEGCRRAYSFLFHEGKPKLPEVNLRASRVESEVFCGWSLKMQRRRSLEPAVAAGSVFHFESGEDEVLALALAALEFLAIGNYKPHGCGQILVENYR
ncbi:MAG: RAMP superfamily CRISPR-associated protein [Candidatus Bathyarchaeota archaeon]|nr:RAMP superfamily CRISPR-associated protein [Candidatus Bathyarchaeota archaeon]